MKEPNYNRKGKEKKQKSKKDEAPKMEICKYDANILESIGKDGDLLSLTDLWKAAGSPTSKDPAQWLRQDVTQQLLETASGILNMCQTHIIKTKRGKSGGSYSHKSIALAYAKYLDPALHVLVNEVFFQRLAEEKNPDLIGQRYLKAYQKKGKSADWTAQRLKSIGTRNTFTKTLAAHGVTGEGHRSRRLRLFCPIFKDSPIDRRYYMAMDMVAQIA